jgi:hypothetical protein
MHMAFASSDIHKGVLEEFAERAHWGDVAQGLEEDSGESKRARDRSTERRLREAKIQARILAGERPCPGKSARAWDRVKAAMESE